MERVKKPAYCYQIGRLMNEHDESQEKLAAAIGVNRDRINNWLNNRSKIDFENLVKIAKHFDVTTDYLLNLPNNEYSIHDAAIFTGLSESAINHVLKFKSSAEDDWNDLSLMLESEIFMRIVPCLDDLRFLYNRCIELMDFISTSSEKELEESDIVEEFSGTFNNLRLLLFELNEMWSDYLESFIPAKKLIADGKELYRKYVTG